MWTLILWFARVYTRWYRERTPGIALQLMARHHRFGDVLLAECIAQGIATEEQLLHLTARRYHPAPLHGIVPRILQGLHTGLAPVLAKEILKDLASSLAFQETQLGVIGRYLVTSAADRLSVLKFAETPLEVQGALHLLQKCYKVADGAEKKACAGRIWAHSTRLLAAEEPHLWLPALTAMIDVWEEAQKLSLRLPQLVEDRYSPKGDRMVAVRALLLLLREQRRAVCPDLVADACRQVLSPDRDELCTREKIALELELRADSELIDVTRRPNLLDYVADGYRFADACRDQPAMNLARRIFLVQPAGTTINFVQRRLDELRRALDEERPYVALELLRVLPARPRTVSYRQSA